MGIERTAEGLGASGVSQRASKGAKRLEKSHPILSKKLKENGGFDMMYFLIEGPMEKHLKAIKEATMFPWQFENTAKKIYAH